MQNVKDEFKVTRKRRTGQSQSIAKSIAKRPDASKFSDVSGSWAEQSINQLANAGIIGGKGAGKFDPNSTASRAESVALILRVLNINLDLGLKL